MDDWQIGIVAGDVEKERRLAAELTQAVGGLLSVRFVPRLEIDEGARWLAAIDSGMGSAVSAAAGSAREGGARAVYLMQDEHASMPQALEQGVVDDVLLRPLRALELLSRLSHLELLSRMEEVSVLQRSLATVAQGFREDLEVVERLHRAKQPRRFEGLKGFKVESRHLSGTRSGGDHFDVMDAADSSQLSLMLSDSSSYGLSSAVLSALMHLGMKFSADTPKSSNQVVRMLFEDVEKTLKERDRLSLFYGIVNRKDFVLRYTHLGNTGLFHSVDGQGFRPIPSQGNALVRGVKADGEGELRLQPKDRIAVISDGFVEAVGGEAQLQKLLDQFRKQDSRDLLNELVFHVKSQLPSKDDLPEQDCTALLIDVDSRVIRLAG